MALSHAVGESMPGIDATDDEGPVVRRVTVVRVCP